MSEGCDALRLAVDQSLTRKDRRHAGAWSASRSTGNQSVSRRTNVDLLIVCAATREMRAGGSISNTSKRPISSLETAVVMW